MPVSPASLEWLQGLLFIVMVVLTLILVLKHMAEARSMQRQTGERKFYTVVECSGGEGAKRVTREYREGDYVGKLVEGDCEGQPGYIVGIYAEEPEKPKSKGFFP